MKITKLIALLAIATFVLSLGGCNTLKGVGRDLQAMGNSIADAADKDDD